MGANTDERLEQAIAALDELIGLVRERGLKPARYIRPPQPDYTAAG